jgi:hypothetical protein
LYCFFNYYCDINYYHNIKKIFTLLVCAALFSSCGSSESSTGSSDSSSTGTTNTSSETASTSKWNYEEETDKMTSGKKFYASIESNNKLEFEFPYDGGSTGKITVRNTEKSNEVLLGISKGQFNTNLDGTPVKVRFDEKNQ